MPIRTIFFGTPHFAVPILEMLCQHPALKMVGVIAQPDKPVGRKQILTAPPTKVVAASYNIEVYQPVSLRNDEALQTIANLKPDLIIVAAYGKIIPESILALPQYQCLNVHPSNLPKYRGASPLQYTIWKNEKETKTTIMVMEATLDTGPIIAQSETYLITPQETYSSLEKTLAQQSAALLSTVIEPWCKQTLVAKPQNNEAATYTKILTKEDGKINWHQTAIEIDCQIRALNPWPSTYTFLDQKRVKILEAQVIKLESKEAPGSLFRELNTLFVVCSNQTTLQIKALQLEGKSKMTAEQFIAGHPHYVPHVLS